MSYPVTIGIDPGVSGAIAVLCDGDLLRLEDMPVAIVGKTRKHRDIMEGQLAQILRPHPGATVWLEAVHSMPGQGVSSSFLFGACYGACKGVAAGLGLRVELVRPQTWKKSFGLIGTDKDAARAVASNLYPGASLARKKDIGRADAILIAHFGVHHGVRTEHLPRIPDSPEDALDDDLAFYV